MIRRLEVKELNNRLSRPFEFHEDLNIFTGPNGSCKTTLLKLIWYLTSGNLERIYPEIPFDFVSIVTDLFSLTITRLDSGNIKFFSEKNSFSKSVDFTVTVDQETGYPDRRDYVEKLHELNVDIVSAMKNSLFFPTFRRIEGGFSNLSRSGDSESDYRNRRASGRLQEAISEFSSAVSVCDHKFIASISTNDIAALLTQKFVPISKKIDDLQVELSQEITRKIKEYFGNEEIVETQTSQKAHEVLEDIQKRVDQVTAERETLLKPFSVLSDLTRNILEYQAVHVTGHVVRSEDIEGITLGEGTEGIALGLTKEAISSDKLSSGEKQMLSFLCYNAFNKNTPVFIDEPELSLHVDWQRLLFPTLLKQGQKNQFFVATHSPFIYAKYPDKEFLLNDNRGGS